MPNPTFIGIQFQFGNVYDAPFWSKILKVVLRWTKKHIIGEQITPWLFGDDSNVYAVILSSTSIAITHPHMFPLIQVA